MTQLEIDHWKEECNWVYSNPGEFLQKKHFVFFIQNDALCYYLLDAPDVTYRYLLKSISEYPIDYLSRNFQKVRSLDPLCGPVEPEQPPIIKKIRAMYKRRQGLGYV